MNLLRGVRRGRRVASSFLATATLVTIGACSPSAVRVHLAPVSPTPTGVHNICQFVWSDLVTDDMATAKRFYGGLFGWQFEDVPGDPVVYSVIRHLGVAIGGIAPIDDGDVNVASARWLSLMSVEDVDAAVDRVRQAGGRVDREPDPS